MSKMHPVPRLTRELTVLTRSHQAVSAEAIEARLRYYNLQTSNGRARVYTAPQTPEEISAYTVLHCFEEKLAYLQAQIKRLHERLAKKADDADQNQLQ